MDEETDIYSSYVICARLKSWHLTSEPTLLITLNRYITSKDKLMFRSKGDYVTMQTNLNILARTFWKRMKAYWKENERNACSFGGAGGGEGAGGKRFQKNGGD